MDIDSETGRDATDEFNVQWNKTRTVIEKNMNWEQMRCYIYLSLLGQQNRAFYDITTTQKGDLDIDDVQAEAEDWDKDKLRDGEGKPAQVALMAQQTNAQTSTRGTQRMSSNGTSGTIDSTHPQWLQVPCVACPPKCKSKHYHCARDCFDGGLSHLTDDEKEMWIMMKRAAKDKKNSRFSDPNNNRNTSRPWHTRRRDNDSQGGGQANLAILRQELKNELQAEAHIAQIREKAEEHGLEQEFEPLLKKPKLFLSSKG